MMLISELESEKATLMESKTCAQGIFVCHPSGLARIGGQHQARTGNDMLPSVSVGSESGVY
jgi:hypothetical protein